MYCQKCGNELKNNESYCPKCGHKVGAKSNVIFIAIIVALVIVILFMMINFVLFNKDNVKVDKQETTIVEEEVPSEEIIKSTASTLDETETSITQTTQQATTTMQTVQATIVQTVPPTTKPVVQTTVAQNMGVLQTAANAAVSFTPPISGTVAAEVQPYQYVEQVVETTESIKRMPVDGRTIEEETENPGPGAYLSPTSAKSTVTEKQVTSTTNREIKVKSTTKITSTIEDDDNHTCKITLLKPLMQGQDDEETENLNSAIEEVIDVLMEEVETVAYEYETLPKSVIFNSATVTSTNKTTIFISLSGSITTRTGGTKSIKYRIIYDREEASAELE